MKNDGEDLDALRCPIPTFERRAQLGHWLKGYDWIAEEKIKAQALRDSTTAEVIPLADHRPKAGEKN